MTLIERARNEANIGHGPARRMINELADELERLQEEAVEAHESWCDRGKRITELEGEVKTAKHEWMLVATNLKQAREELEHANNQWTEYEHKCIDQRERIAAYEREWRPTLQDFENSANAFALEDISYIAHEALAAIPKGP